MAEELANAIVAASNKMQRRSPGPKTLGCVRTGHFEFNEESYDFAAQIGTDGFFHTHCVVAAMNYMWENGYTQMNESEEKHWMELIERMESTTPGGSERYERGKVLMVFSIEKEEKDKEEKKNMTKEAFPTASTASKPKRKRNRRRNKKKKNGSADAATT